MTDQFALAWNALSYLGELRWFCKRGPFDALGGVARSPEELAERVSANERGYNCYVQLNPAVGFKGLRTSAEHVTHFRGFLLDIDPDPEWQGDMVSALKVSAEHLAQKIGVEPLLVDSGRGAQAWFCGEPCVPGQADWRQVARRAVRALVKSTPLTPGVHADAMVCDVARVVRLPGTKNVRTGRVATLLCPGAPRGGLFETLAQHDPGESENAEASLEGSYDSYREVWLELTGTAQRFIQEGAKYPGRHSVLWHTADLLFKRGLTREAAVRALWMGCSASQPALDWADLQYAVGRAYKKVD